MKIINNSLEHSFETEKGNKHLRNNYLDDGGPSRQMHRTDVQW